MFSAIGYVICIPFATLLRLFYTLTGSYGISLILFTLVIKLFLFPFQMKSKKSMVRMSRMSGQLQEIQRKYANNQMLMSQEMQKFYEEEGVNPMSGCLWSFLPMPILLALYYIIREPIVYFMNFGSREEGRAVLKAARGVIENAGITLSGNVTYEQIEISNIINKQFPDFVAAHEGWVNLDYHFLGIDLTAMPSSAFSGLKEGFSIALIGLMLIPIISGLLSLLLSKVTMGQTKVEGPAALTNKMMMWVMPLMSVYIGFILPAALGIYWIAQSGLSILQEMSLGRYYNNKLQREEDERAAARQADRERRREEARLLQIEQRKEAARKKTLKEKQAAAHKAKEEKAKKSAHSTTEAGRVGGRPYARGRSYQEDRYDDVSKTE